MHEASTRRTYVMAHCHTDEGARRCVECGVRSIEHGTQISDDTARLIAGKDVFVVPTLSVADVIRQHGPTLGLPPMALEKIKAVYEDMLRSIEACARAGVRIGQLGCIRPGAYADLLLIDGNPLDDLNLFREPRRNIPLVMKGGAVVRSRLA